MAELFAIDERAELSAEPELVLGPEEDVRAHGGLGNHRVVAIAFPKWRDGRGYSSARILREAGFEGDIRAVGDLTVDQLVFLKRAGFSSLAPERAIDREVAARALARYEFVYQKAADGRAPAWALRHRDGAA
ncbi:DUF934 domain-containing protein [Sandaracinobacter sp. RS1-74]|uniref:DUF934 domain-containing protein n=1 Tax=Sandaracinobacteroides sayramensis TaxID=2913411 RepID=UPI001EDC3BD6|nr:DUF934 domain-containing protein [Sandaracinobacteroides sayramensis]MCG2839776.1 DUF934 domain-containing protein [Sandaracinobacteroides sayramensis]